MTTQRRTICLTFAAILLAAHLQAQTVDGSLDQISGLSLDDAVARALANEPSLRAARSEVDVVLGTMRQADVRSNPTLTFEHRREPAGTDKATTAGIEWPLELFRRSGRRETTQREVSAAQLSLADRERLLAAEVRLAYGRAAAANRERVVAEDVVNTVRKQFELIAARVEEGAAPPLDRDRLDVELRRLQAESIRAAGRSGIAIVELKRRIGARPDEVVTLRDSLEMLVVGSSASSPDSNTTASAVRSDVAAAEARIAVADARIEQVRGEGKVDVSLVGAYMRMDAGFPQSGFDDFGRLAPVRGRFNYVSAGAMVTVPLFNRNEGLADAARAERASAEARRDAVVLAAQAETAIARVQIANAQKALDLYSGEARTLARRNVDVVRQTFELGRATAIDVITEQRRYLEFEQGATAAMQDLWEARVAVARAVGETK